MKVFQTPTSKKRKMWHLFNKTKNIAGHIKVEPICGSFGYWVGGYHDDHPEMTLENANIKEYTGTENLCLQCVQRAVKTGLFKIG